MGDYSQTYYDPRGRIRGSSAVVENRGPYDPYNWAATYDRLWLVGGYDVTAAAYEDTIACFNWDLNGFEAGPFAVMPVPVEAPMVVEVARKLWVVGGQNQFGNGTTTRSYDIATNTWATHAAYSPPVDYAWQQGMVLGLNNSLVAYGVGQAGYITVQRYSISTNTWSSSGSPAPVFSAKERLRVTVSKDHYYHWIFVENTDGTTEGVRIYDGSVAPAAEDSLICWPAGVHVSHKLRPRSTQQFFFWKSGINYASFDPVTQNWHDNYEMAGMTPPGVPDALIVFQPEEENGHANFFQYGPEQVLDVTVTGTPMRRYTLSSSDDLRPERGSCLDDLTELVWRKNQPGAPYDNNGNYDTTKTYGDRDFSVVEARGYIWKFGGQHSGTTYSTLGSPALHRYDYASDTWTRMTPAPTELVGTWRTGGKYRHSCAVWGKYLYFFAGVEGGASDPAGRDLSRETWRYDMDTDTWDQTSRARHTGIFYTDNACVVVGDYAYLAGHHNGLSDAAYDAANPSYAAYAAFWRYDFNADSWTQMAYRPRPTSNELGLWVYNGDIYVLQCYPNWSGESPGEIFKYDIALNTWDPILIAKAPMAVINAIQPAVVGDKMHIVAPGFHWEYGQNDPHYRENHYVFDHVTYNWSVDGPILDIIDQYGDRMGGNLGYAPLVYHPPSGNGILLAWWWSTNNPANTTDTLDPTYYDQMATWAFPLSAPPPAPVETLRAGWGILATPS